LIDLKLEKTHLSKRLKATNALVLMTKDFEIIMEQKISTENSSESHFVNVGWGSFETQFKGSEGKKAVKEKVNY
jgi:hypothetical protein